MASETDICNIALARVGATPIDSLADTSKAGNSCRALYSTIRNAVLRDKDWRFARTEMTLMPVADTFVGWSYVYQYPANCLRAVKVVEPGLPVSPFVDAVDPNSVADFDVYASKDLNSKVVVANIGKAVLAYIALISNPTVFDVQFVDVLAWRLASELAVPLLGNFQLQGNLYNVYLRQLGEASTNSANEASTAPSDANPLSDSRL